jgi:hypothetical protein
LWLYYFFSIFLMRNFLVYLISCFLVVGLFGCSSSAFLIVEESSIDLPIEAEELLVDFLQLIKNDWLKKAYSKTNVVFESHFTFSQFEAMAEIGKLGDIQSVKWIAQTPTESNILAVSLLLSFENQASRNAYIDLIEVRDEWFIEAISLDISQDSITASFPTGEVLARRMVHDLERFSEAVRNDTMRRDFYDQMATFQGQLSWDEFDVTLTSIAQNQMDIVFSREDVVGLADDSPKFYGKQVVVEGNYVRGDSVILYKFIYDFEWVWKINSFVIDGDAMKNKSVDT